MRDYVKHSYKRLNDSFKFRLFVLIGLYSCLLFCMAETIFADDNNWQRVRTNSLEDISVRQAKPVSGKNVTENEKVIKTFTYSKGYSAKIQYIEDDSMYLDEKKVVQEATSGEKRVTVMVTYEEDQKEEQRVIDEEVIVPAKPEVVCVGTKERPEYIVPVEGYVFTSGFGPRWGSVHCGIDLAVPVGTEVSAAAAGTVIQSGQNGGYGISVYVEHENGSITRYGHMSETCVSVGQAVQQGEIIGYSGNTGDSTGPHLHFEIRIGGEAVNPLNYVTLEN